MSQTILDRLAEILSDILGTFASEVNHNSRFREDLHADDTDIEEIRLCIAEEWDIDLRSVEFVTVGDAVEYITNATK
jgi:acyl carrier protein